MNAALLNVTTAARIVARVQTLAWVVLVAPTGQITGHPGDQLQIPRR
jgi:hypothetical protein